MHTYIDMYNSLQIYTHEPSMNYLPEARFRCLTFVIVAVSLITGILIPNIEFVLGLVGSTIGVMICLIFPAIFFISISSKHTNERLLAQVRITTKSHELYYPLFLRS